jgi:hypothetical protein
MIIQGLIQMPIQEIMLETIVQLTKMMVPSLQTSLLMTIQKIMELQLTITLTLSLPRQTPATILLMQLPLHWLGMTLPMTRSLKLVLEPS